MKDLAEGYPYELGDEDLREALASLFQMYRESYPAPLKDQLPELKLAFIQAGLTEQARRATVELRIATQASTRTAQLIAKWSLFIAGAGVLIAAGSLVASLLQ